MRTRFCLMAEFVLRYRLWGKSLVSIMTKLPQLQG